MHEQFKNLLIWSYYINVMSLWSPLQLLDLFSITLLYTEFINKLVYYIQNFQEYSWIVKDCEVGVLQCICVCWRADY